MMVLLAQEGSQNALKVIVDSLNLSGGVTESWNELWQALLLGANEQSLWQSIVQFALRIAVLALIYFAIQHGNEVMKTQSFSQVIEMFITPLVVIFLLGGNGQILSRIILVVRGLGRTLIGEVLSKQALGIALDRSIVEVNSNLYAMQRVRQVFQECAALTGQPLTDCITTKQSEAQAIVDGLGTQTPVQAAQAFLNNIAAMANPAATLGGVSGSFIQGGFSQVIQDQLVPIIQALLYAIQWAFVNILEAALLLTALFAPIAVALMLLPMAGNALAAWFTGFISLLSIQLGYNLLVGLVALVLVHTDRQDAVGVAGSFGFLVFLAIFSPALAVQIGRGGGAMLYDSISRYATAMLSTATQFVASGVQLAVLRGR